MLGHNRYRFQARWTLEAPPERVYSVLERAEEYPRWWPQVRGVVMGGADGGRGRIRSVLPFELRVTAWVMRRDPAARVLEIVLSGDIEGWARWTVRPCGDGAVALFAQEVEARRRLLRLLAIPGRPFFVVNHTLMMRAGQRGLRAALRRGLDEG
ncbi:SRPBCC family protein [Streptomyces cacaoi]|uniref:SRPBCC family protein n=1 Tax=Streptomyces cacaoi TaxID=1898 RepID=UPI002624ABC8|nr:SRPBCC family protein [Streptomyces cacaoi]